MCSEIIMTWFELDRATVLSKHHPCSTTMIRTPILSAPYPTKVVLFDHQLDSETHRHLILRRPCSPTSSVLCNHDAWSLTIISAAPQTTPSVEVMLRGMTQSLKGFALNFVGFDSCIAAGKPGDTEHG
jgi:hypothetical protein